jgi:hypothetical protein
MLAHRDPPPNLPPRLLVIHRHAVVFTLPTPSDLGLSEVEVHCYRRHDAMEYRLVQGSVPVRTLLAFIDRAGTAPLDIRINERHEAWYKEHMNDIDDGEEDGHPFTAEMMEEVMDKLLLKIRTIRTLVIMVDTWKPALVVLNKLRWCDDLPERMERFELHRTGRPWLWVGPMPEPRKRSAPIPFCGRRILPRLTYACFNGLHIRWSVPQMSNCTCWT